MKHYRNAPGPGRAALGPRPMRRQPMSQDQIDAR